MLNRSQLHNLLIYSESNDSKNQKIRNISANFFTDKLKTTNTSSQYRNLSPLNQTCSCKSQCNSISHNFSSSISRKIINKKKKNSYSSSSFISRNISFLNTDNNLTYTKLKSLNKKNNTFIRRPLSTGIKKIENSSFYEDHLNTVNQYEISVNLAISEKFKQFKALRKNVENLKSRVYILRLGGESTIKSEHLNTDKLITKITKIREENVIDIPKEIRSLNSLIKENQMKIDNFSKSNYEMKVEEEIEIEKIRKIEIEINNRKQEIKKINKYISTYKSYIQSYKKACKNICFRINNNNLMNQEKRERVKSSYCKIKGQIDKYLKL